MTGFFFISKSYAYSSNPQSPAFQISNSNYKQAIKNIQKLSAYHKKLNYRDSLGADETEPLTQIRNLTHYICHCKMQLQTPDSQAVPVLQTEKKKRKKEKKQLVVT